MYQKKKEDYFEEFLTNVSSVLEDLCQSGSHTVHDSTLQELKELGKNAAQCGMQHLSELLLALQEELSLRRHKISDTSKTDSSCAKYYTELMEYIDFGKEKTAWDKGRDYYCGKKEDCKHEKP